MFSPLLRFNILWVCWAAALCLWSWADNKAFSPLSDVPKGLLKPLSTDTICKWQWTGKEINNAPPKQWWYKVYDHRWDTFVPFGSLRWRRITSTGWRHCENSLCCFGLNWKNEKAYIQDHDALEIKLQTPETNGTSHWCIVQVLNIYVCCIKWYWTQ